MDKQREARLRLVHAPQSATPSVPLHVQIRDKRLNPPVVVPPLGGALVAPAQVVLPAVQQAIVAVQQVQQVDSSNEAIMRSIQQIQAAVPIIMGKIKDVEDHQKELRSENVRLHDRTVAAISEFRAFAAENFDELKRGVTAAAGFFAGGCFGGIQRNIVLRIAQCMFLFFCFVFGMIKMAVEFYLKMRKALITAFSIMFAGYGPFVMGVVYNIISIMVTCIEVGWTVVMMNTVGSYWPFRTERLGMKVVLMISQLFTRIIQLFFSFFTNLFNPFFDVVKEVTGFDLRNLFTFIYDFLNKLVDMWEYLCSWRYAPSLGNGISEVGIGEDDIPESAEFVSHISGVVGNVKTKASEAVNEAGEVLVAAPGWVAEKLTSAKDQAMDAAARLASAADFARRKVLDNLPSGAEAPKVPKVPKVSAKKFSSMLKPRHKKGGGVVGFEEAYYAFKNTQGFENRFGYIVVMLALMSEPTFDNKYLTAYVSNPIVEKMTSELYKRITVFTKFFSTGKSHVVHLERPLVPGLGMGRPTRKYRGKVRQTKKSKK